VAILVCAGILAVCCLTGSVSTCRPGEELIRMIGLIAAIDYAWRRIAEAKTTGPPGRTKQ
jgi:hypothetical protein